MRWARRASSSTSCGRRSATRSASSARPRSCTTVPGRVADSDPFEEHIALVGKVRELRPAVDAVVDALIGGYAAGGRVYTFGNGGSSADAAHFAEELIGRFKRERRALPAHTVSNDPSAPAGTSHHH